MKQKISLRKKTFIALAAFSLMMLLSLSMTSYATAKPPEQDESHGRGLSMSMGKAKGHNVPIAKGLTFNITAMGTAYNITNTSITNTARVTFNATVHKASMGAAILKVTEGELKIGNTVYSIEKGWGLISLHSGKIVVHLRVTDPDGAKLHVMLKGNLTEELPSPFEVGSSVDVVFKKPQSKLGTQFFLDLTGTLKRVG